MEAINSKSGEVVIRYNPHNFDRLYSPDGKLHLLPCEGDCGRAVWVQPLTESVLCEDCHANPAEPDIDEFDLTEGNKE
jgi:hypothetical protein